MAITTKVDWKEYLTIERRIDADFNGYGIFTLSHNECVGECLTLESAEYHADLLWRISISRGRKWWDSLTEKQRMNVTRLRAEARANQAARQAFNRLTETGGLVQ